MTDKRKITKFIGPLGVIVGVSIQVIAAILQTNPSMNMNWALISFVFIFPGCIQMVEEYVAQTEQVNERISLFLLVFGLIAIIFQIVFYNALVIGLIPRIIILNLLIMDSVAIFLTGLLFPRIADSSRQVGELLED